ncbi:MAG: hypothetical protein IJU81_08860 [Bacteroidales bacterium]|nr:hypothetical protein [Bacteroidales bacterium]
MKTINYILVAVAFATMSALTSCQKDPASNPDYSSTLDAQGERGVGALPGKFSVSPDRMVRFSQGNLQYCVNIDSHLVVGNQMVSGSWRFAANQYDYIGYRNVNSDSTLAGITDLFGWATSGWSAGNYESSPRSISVYSESYAPSHDHEVNLTGDNVYGDWGQFNAISNGGDAPGLWRTLSQQEWIYIFHQRENTRINGIPNIRFAKGQVHNVNGLLLFPNEYRHPNRVALPVEINMMDGNFSKNHYTGADWDSLQAAGVVFLPAAGMRYGTTVSKVQTYGNYWSSTACNKNNAYYIYFLAGAFDPASFGYRCNGRSVRLVQDVKVK